MRLKYYTGIGSRSTPKNICTLFSKAAVELHHKGYILRSGGAEGADKSFEAITSLFSDFKSEIYLPWQGFNESKSFYYLPKNSYQKSSIEFSKVKEAEQIAATIHPNWNACSYGAKLLHTRNIFQVLGNDLKTPSEFLIAYTDAGKPIGGTRTAILLAEQNNIPIINVGSTEGMKTFRNLIENL